MLDEEHLPVPLADAHLHSPAHGWVRVWACEVAARLPFHRRCVLVTWRQVVRGDGFHAAFIVVLAKSQDLLDFLEFFVVLCGHTDGKPVVFGITMVARDWTEVGEGPEGKADIATRLNCGRARREVIVVVDL